MVSLLVTVMSIALVIALALAAIYYGGQALQNQKVQVAAETLLNQSVQIASAHHVAVSQGISLAQGDTVTIPQTLLNTMPVPPQDAYVSGTPSASDWKYYVPGQANFFGLQGKLTEKACMAVNNAQKFSGIPAVWDGTSSVQCFGTGVGGYTYIFQPTGQTPAQVATVLDKSLNDAKPVIPTATAGYPRLCPDGTKITSGLCAGATPPPPTPPTCANGGTNYPTCTPPTCSNGASDYPTCTPPTCANGGTNYPTCTPPTCANGGTNYPTCTPPTCANGASDYPTCTPPAPADSTCLNGGTDYPTCTPRPCDQLSPNYPSCLQPTQPTCANGATDYPTCTPPTCSNGASDYPTCTPPTCSNGATDYPTCTPPVVVTQPPPTPKNGFWVIKASVGADRVPSLTSQGFADTCPTGAINPTTSAAQPVATKADEPFNVDGVMDLGWALPSAHTLPYTTALTRTWCLPAKSTDTIYVGDMADPVSGDVIETVFTATPANNKINGNYYHGSSNAAVTLTANGVSWTLLASDFEMDVYTSTKSTLWMVGRKIAIGKTSTATSTYFTSTSVTYSSTTYQYQSGRVTFPTPGAPKAPPQLCDPALNISTLGVGGNIVDVKGTDYWAAILKADGSVWTTGVNSYGALGICNSMNLKNWTRIATNVLSMDVDPTLDHIYMTKQDGTLWVSGKAQSWEFGPGYPNNNGNPTNYDIKQLQATNVIKSGGGYQWSALMKNDGSIWFTGYNVDGEAGSGGAYQTVINTWVNVTSGATKMWAGEGQIFFLKSDNSLWASGSTGSSHLGYTDNVSLTTGTPKQIATGIAKAVGNKAQSVIITTDGRAFAAGYDSWSTGMFGQGTGTAGNTLTTYTQLIPTAGQIVDATVTPKTIKLLGADGRLWASGGNEFGYFGDGTKTNTSTFKVIATNVAKISAGPHYVDKAGALWAAGTNVNGNFGDGTTTQSLTFKQVQY